MLFVFLMEALLVTVLMAVVTTQLLFPLVLGTRLFPALRKNPRSLWTLEKAEEEIQYAEIEKRVRERLAAADKIREDLRKKGN